MKLKKGDTVIVLSGKHRGERADILRVLPSRNAVVLDSLNIAKRHLSPRASGRGRQNVTQRGIIDKFMPMDASAVALWCDQHGGPARAGVRIEQDGKKTRVCRKCGATL